VAKKDTPKKKDPEAGKKQQSRGDAVRAAAAQAIEATAGQAGFTRERAQQIADELVSAAGRFRPAGSDEIAALRERVEALEARIQKLEAARTTTRRRTTPAKRPPAQKPPASPPPASST